MNYVLYCIIAGIIIGAIQGILEWIPVSSEAFVFLAAILLGLSPLEALSIAIFLHFATALAAMIRFKQEYEEAIISIFRENQKGRKLLMFILIGTFFSIIVALPLRLYENILLKSFSLDIIILLIGVLMVTIGLIIYKTRRIGNKVLINITKKDAAIIGFVQGFSVLPGVSRSGVTITALLLMQYKNTEAVKGSFLLLAPISILAGLYEVFVTRSILIVPTLVISAFVFTLLFSFLTIRFMLNVAQRINAGSFLIMIGILFMISCIFI